LANAVLIGVVCPLLIIAGKLGEVGGLLSSFAFFADVAQRTGQAKITILVGSCLMAVASGLLTLINKSSSIGMLVGFEIIAGIGFGCVLNIS
jgi:Na+/melibiose symporter-like transporter